jgi:hypothetical protein
LGPITGPSAPRAPVPVSVVTSDGGQVDVIVCRGRIVDEQRPGLDHDCDRGKVSCLHRPPEADLPSGRDGSALGSAREGLPIIRS